MVLNYLDTGPTLLFSSLNHAILTSDKTSGKLKQAKWLKPYAITVLTLFFGYATNLYTELNTVLEYSEIVASQ
jgi:hypothetical protein